MSQRLSALILALTAAAGCSAPAALSLAELNTHAEQLEIINLGHPYPTIWTAGQVSEEQMTALAQDGLAVFISLRQADEPGAGWEEQAAERLGVRFSRLPVAGGPDVNWQSAGALHDLLAELGDQPVMVYCGSSNRVGALLALRANASLGLSVDEALELGRSAGMTRLEPVVAQKLKR